MVGELKVVNITEVVFAMRRSRDRMTGRFVTTTRAAAEEIMATSKREYVPYDTHALQNSGRVVTTTSPNGSPVHEMTYGGTAEVPYALWVHEISKNYNHGRQWKYLETPAKMYSYAQRLRDLWDEDGGEEE